MASTIHILRFKANNECTLSKIYVNSVFVCIGLEPPLKDMQKDLFSPFAIPPGTYHLKWLYSPKFKNMMPHIEDVPFYKFIMFHAGNYPHQTKGCVILGKSYHNNSVLNSRDACNLLFPMLDSLDGTPIIIQNPLDALT